MEPSPNNLQAPLPQQGSSSLFKATTNLFSPIKDYNPFDTPHIKTDIKLQMMSSPFVNNWFINETPNSRVFSPFVSTSQNKISYTNFNLVQKNLLAEFSPQILLSSPTKSLKGFTPINLTKQFENVQGRNITSELNKRKRSIEENDSKTDSLSESSDEDEIDSEEDKDVVNIDDQLLFLKKIYKYKASSSSSETSFTDHSERNNLYFLNTFNFNLTQQFANSANTLSTAAKPRCKCSKSKCLKLYCECFANGRTCDEECGCIDCMNTVENENNRKHVYRMIIAKNPKAIMRIKSIKKSWTCKCKNSNCQKNYCDCYQNGKFCSSKCKCIDCKNKNKLKKNNKRSNKKNPVINRSKSKKNTINEIPIEAMYTPQKKNYRTVKSTTANKMLSTAYTDISLPNPLPIDRTQSKPSSIFKRLDMDIDINNIK